MEKFPCAFGSGNRFWLLFHLCNKHFRVPSLHHWVSCLIMLHLMTPWAGGVWLEQPAWSKLEWCSVLDFCVNHSLPQRAVAANLLVPAVAVMPEPNGRHQKWRELLSMSLSWISTFHLQQMATPPRVWFYQRSLPVKREFFIPTLTRCLLKGHHLIVGVYSVLQSFICCCFSILSFKFTIVQKDRNCRPSEQLHDRRVLYSPSPVGRSGGSSDWWPSQQGS